MTINKTSDDQKKMHSSMINSFALALNGHSLDLIGNKLHEDGLFLGKYSKQRFLAYLYALFFNEKDGLHNYHVTYVNYGTALNKFPGAEVLEIRCLKKRFPRSSFGMMEDPFIGERVFRFCFQFKDDLIYAVERPTRFTRHVEKMKSQN